MRRILSFIIVFIVLTGTGLFVAFAAPTNFSVDTTDQANVSTCSQTFYYESFNYTAAASGTYEISFSNINTPDTPLVIVHTAAGYDAACADTDFYEEAYPGNNTAVLSAGDYVLRGMVNLNNATGSFDFSIVLLPPVSGFSYSATDLTVDFTDTSSNSPNAWAWDFGDGYTSADQNPAHTYAADGTYNVCLTASNIESAGNEACLTVTVEEGVTSGGGVKSPTPNKDADGDGIPNHRDNCVHDYNPGQEDGWGSGAGDTCDTDWYNMTGIGIAGFTQKSGMYHLHGNCTYMADGDPRCPEIAVFNPATFTPEQMPMELTSDAAGTWSVWIYYLHSNGGKDVYQVNVYTTNPPQPDTLIDDRLEFHVRGGVWEWYQRGGSKNYNGN